MSIEKTAYSSRLPEALGKPRVVPAARAVEVGKSRGHEIQFCCPRVLYLRGFGRLFVGQPVRPPQPRLQPITYRILCIFRPSEHPTPFQPHVHKCPLQLKNPLRGGSTK